MQCRISHRKNKRTGTAALFFLAFLVLSGYFAFLANQKLGPGIENYTEFECNRIANESIATALSKTLEQTPDFSSELYTVRYDSAGKAVAILTDSARLNRARVLLTQNAEAELRYAANQKYRVAFGSLLENYLLIGRGPRLTLRIQPQSYLKSEIISSLENVGVNQTAFSLQAVFTIEINTTLGGYRCKSNITNTVPLVQAIFAGETPRYYGD